MQRIEIDTSKKKKKRTKRSLTSFKKNKKIKTIPGHHWAPQVVLVVKNSATKEET